MINRRELTEEEKAFKEITEYPIILDFSLCNQNYDIHNLLKDKFGFPDYHGENWSALWDCLDWLFYDEGEVIVEIHNFNSLSEYKLHAFCRCIITWMQAIMAGKATKKGKDGADYWIKYYYELPDYYITETEAKQLGWVRYKGNLHKVAPGKMITRGIYYNDNNHLPVENGRIWYEADINYTTGYRKDSRIVFSNDGLIFITHDHYKTFIEIT